jgi:hypothetical protein
MSNSSRIIINVPVAPIDIGNSKIEVSTDAISWQEVNNDELTDLDNPGTELYVRITAENGPVTIKTLKAIYS